MRQRRLKLRSTNINIISCAIRMRWRVDDVDCNRRGRWLQSYRFGIRAPQRGRIRGYYGSLVELSVIIKRRLSTSAAFALALALAPAPALAHLVFLGFRSTAG